VADVGFTIGGDNSEFLAAIKQSQAAVAQASASIRDSLKGMSSGFKETQTNFEGLGDAADGIRDKINAAFEFTGIAAAGEVIERVGAAIEKISGEARQLSTDSQLLGVSVEQFQAMAHAAEEAGVGAETLTHAGERLINMLTEARAGSSTAIDKLLTLGVTTLQIQDPLFGINDLFGILRDRLNNSATSTTTMNALLQTLGNRAAAAAVALKEYDGSAQSVAKIMDQLNGLNEKQVDSIKRVGAAYDTLGTKISNAFKKFLVGTGEKFEAPGAFSMSNAGSAQLAQQDVDSQSKAGAASPTVEAKKEESQTKAELDDIEAQNYAVVQQKIQEIGLKNIEFGIAATKEGSAARLEALKAYAAAAEKLYGPDAPSVEKANEKVLAAQFSYNERMKAGLEEVTQFEWQNNMAIYESRLRLSIQSAKAQQEYVKEMKKFQDELNQLTETGIELDNSVIKLRAEQTKQVENYNKQVRADFEKQYKGIATSITNSLSGALTNMLTHTKSWRSEMANIFESLVSGIIKHFVQMGVEWAEVQLENLILSKITAKGQVEASAGAAGAAGTASFAGAPWPVDLGAPAFGAGMAAAAASFAVAERGFDVPSGINPLTQLHSREMVLPAPLADTIRSRMADGDMGNGGEHHYYSGDVNIAHQDLRAMVGSRSAQRELIKTIATGLRRGARPR
jgi:hypothetical protein